MARRPALGGGTLNPFGGGGVDFGAFNILDPGREAYLVFLKVETSWQAGKTSDADYLTALDVYAKAQPADSSDRVSIEARLEQTRYRIERNVLVSKVDNGEATAADLVAYDKGKLEGLTHDSDEYRQRLDLYRQSQAKWVNDAEADEVKLYQDGKITTAQLRSWYQGVAGSSLIDNNPDLSSSLGDRIHELDGRVQDERDNKMLSDFQDGKIRTADFIAYATAAKARYGAGTTQAAEWSDRIEKARQSSGETSLLYRYNLSQQYAELERFVKSNSGKPAGGTSTSTSTRVVMGADGKWHTVTSTSTKSHAPSKSEVAAYAKLQIEIADAKKQMAQIAHKIAGVGGFTSTATVTKFYQSQLGKYARGSADWYRIQEKLDSLSSAAHQEQVYGKEGIKITYPSGGGGSSSSAGAGGHSSASGGSSSSGGQGGGGYTLAQFMRAIATQESGGRYDARNSSSGAYGKYQIMPANWSSWAQKAGLPANAPQTPENQEKVATAAFARLAQSYHGDWGRVAAAWFAGVAGSANEATWGPRTKRYVAAIMSHLGTTRQAVAGGGYSPATISGGGSVAAGRSGPVASAPVASTQPPAGSGAGHGTTDPGHGPLAIVTDVGSGGPKHPTGIVSTRSTGFPAGLDGRAFERFYANYEHAFENGDEVFVDTSSGKPVAYFIGDDAAERIDRMRQLDDLRVSLYDTRAVAYQGTPSELTAANQRNEAYKDVARHEYLIVDTANPTASGSAKLNAQTNPLGSGIRLLDKTEAAIKSNLDMAKAAFKRGDVTGAYSLLQMAQNLLDANSAAMTNLAGYAQSSQAAIAGIEKATGGIDPAEALGADKGGAFAKDLERLRNFNVELTSLFTGDKEATDVLTQIKGHVATDGAGNVVYDDSGPQGKLTLKDDSYFHLKPDGSVELLSAPPTQKNGQTVSGLNDKTVTVRIKAGSDVIEAQADYTIGEVGGVIDAAGQYHPLMGKVVQQRGADGKWTTFYENPLAPGTTAGWSSQPYKITAPQGFTASLDANGNTVYTFTAGQTGSQQVGGRGATSYGSGITYKLSFDPKSGTYVVLGSKAGGLFDPGYQDAVVGRAGDANMSALFGDAGFVRQGGAGDFGSSDIPVFGMTQSQYDAWQRSFQAPAMKAIYGEGSGRGEGWATAQAGLRAAVDTAHGAASDALAARARAEYGIRDTAAREVSVGAASDALSKRAQAEHAIRDAQNRAAGQTAMSSALEARAKAEAAIRDRAKLPSVAPILEAAGEAAAAVGRTALPKVTPPPSKKYGSEPAAKAPAKQPAAAPKKSSTRHSTARAPLPKPKPPPTRTTSTRQSGF